MKAAGVPVKWSSVVVCLLVISALIIIAGVKPVSGQKVQEVHFYQLDS
jgi:hypothetical protein